MELDNYLVNLGVALVLGLIIGFERQWQNKAAGLRTNALVAVGAALFVTISVKMTAEQGDVTRIISQIVTGIGFLGAGIIFRIGADVHGLTTAATIWCSAAVGSLAGCGLILEAIIGAGVVIIINLFLIPLDDWLRKRRTTATTKARSSEIPEGETE